MTRAGRSGRGLVGQGGIKTVGTKRLRHGTTVAFGKEHIPDEVRAKVNAVLKEYREDRAQEGEITAKTRKHAQKARIAAEEERADIAARKIIEIAAENRITIVRLAESTLRKNQRIKSAVEARLVELQKAFAHLRDQK